MALNNYSDLKATVADYLNRDDLTNQISDFIDLAQKRLAKRFRDVGTISSANPTTPFFLKYQDAYIYGSLMEAEPFLGADERVQLWTGLYDRAVAEIRIPDTNSNLSSYSGLQAAVSDWLDRPDIDGSIPSFINLAESKLKRKFKGITNLSSANTVNSFLTSYPDVYLYGALIEAESYLKDDARIPLWAGMYDSSIASVRIPDTNANLSDYAGLQAAISDWLDRADIDVSIPSFINLAESKLKRKFKGITSLSSTNTVNSFLTSYPDVYLYGSLVEAEAYLKDDVRIPLWASMYDSSVASVRIPDTNSDLSNYSGLQATISDWLDRPDIDISIPSFIELAESKLKRKFKGITELSSTSPTNSFLTSYPDVYLYSSLIEAEAYLKDDARIPLWASMYDSSVAEVRIPDTNSDLSDYAGLQATISDWLDRPDIDGSVPSFIELAESKLKRRFKGITTLTDSNTTNYFLTSYPDAYLYGALVEAESYLKDDVRIPLWAGLYERAVAEIRIPDTSSNLSNYAGLKAAISDWLDRPDIDNSVPAFIELAESKLKRKFKGITDLSDSNTSNDFLASYPDAYLYGSLVEAEAYLKDDARMPLWAALYDKSVAEIRIPDTNANLSNYSGLKAAISDWLDRPDIDGAVPSFIELAESKLKRKFKGISTLSDSNTSNSFLTSYPDAYLYGSLVEAEAYLKDDARIPLWASLYDKAVAEIRIPDTNSDLSNYVGLKSTISDWLDRPDIDNSIPSFIELAESKLKRKFRGISTLSDSNTSNDFLTSYPDAYLYGSLIEAEAYLKDDVRIPVWSALYDQSVAEIRIPDTNANLSNYAGLKAAISDWLDRPDIDSSIPAFIELAESKLKRKFKGISALSDSNTSNSFLTSYPDAYLYGSLVEAEGYLKDDVRIPLWAGLYDQAVAGIRIPDTSSDLSNYGGLKAAISDWLDRPDIDNSIPSFIELAESKLKRKFKGITTLSDSNTSNSFLTSYPDAYLYGSLVEAEAYLKDDSRIPLWAGLYDQSVAGIRIPDTSADLSSYVGLKAAISDWLNRPDIDDSIPSFIELAESKLKRKFKGIIGLSDSVSTNDFLTSYPDAYLYGSLVEAEAYLKDDSRIPLWASLYEKSVEGIRTPDTATGLTTYAGLKAAVSDWLSNEQLTAIVPTFIALAESQINRDVRHWRMENRATSTMTTQYLARPDDWVETIRLKSTGSGTMPLQYLSGMAMDERRASGENVAGEPRYYRHVETQFEVWPSPSSSVDVELIYFQKLPELSGSNATNWLLLNAPDVYLYGALVAASPYLGDDARVAVWAQMYATSVLKLNEESEKAKYSGSGLSMRVKGLDTGRSRNQYYYGVH